MCVYITSDLFHPHTCLTYNQHTQRLTFSIPNSSFGEVMSFCRTSEKGTVSVLSCFQVRGSRSSHVVVKCSLNAVYHWGKHNNDKLASQSCLQYYNIGLSCYRSLTSIQCFSALFITSYMNRMNPFLIRDTYSMYSKRHLGVMKENLIKHLHHHREQFLHQT